MGTKALVVMLGQLRADKLTWESTKRNLLDELEADLAVCAPADSAFRFDNAFFREAKYKWIAPSFQDNAEVFDQIQAMIGGDEDWRTICQITGNWLGGISASGQQGAGSILFYLRWFLLLNLKSGGLLQKYDWFVVTRSDFYYLCPHPPLECLDPKFIWLPEGEDYGGLTDRHLVVSSERLVECLNLIEDILLRPHEITTIMNSRGPNWNIERYIHLHYERNGLLLQVRRFPYIMFLVRGPDDPTAWSEGTYRDDIGMIVKYESELSLAKSYEGLITSRKDWERYLGPMGESEYAKITKALSLLTPIEIPAIGKVRIGNPLGDGGYVLANRLRPGQKVYSYGIEDDVSFDLDLAHRELCLFMYDHTIDQLPSMHANFRFYRQGIGAKDEPDYSLYRLESHIRNNGHTDHDMILKMDIEGAEWDVLDKMEPALLERFEQVIIEAHGCENLGDSGFRARFVRIFSKLVKYFHLIHVHANNHLPIFDVLGLQIPSLLELTFLRKGLGEATPWRTFIPCELDSPNRPGTDDYVLAFFPFLPMGMSPEQFQSELTRAFQRSTLPMIERIPKRGVNITWQASCSQSSYSEWSVGPEEAIRALRLNTVPSGSYAFHTDLEDGPWWQIDLGKECSFDEIRCFNRIGPWSDRADTLIVEILSDGSAWEVVHRNHERFGGTDGKPLCVIHPRMTARYIRLRLPVRNYLHLDAVQVFDWSGDIYAGSR
jgi:hypothetical protein